MIETKIDRCLLTGKFLNGVAQLEGQTYVYTTPLTGKVIIALPTAIALNGSGLYDRPNLAGLCREAHELKTDTPVITLDLIYNTIKELNLPNRLPEKALRLLNLLYNIGGKDYKPIDLRSGRDYPMAFADDENEFIRILQRLEDKNWIKIADKESVKGIDALLYDGVELTDKGIAEVEKGLPSLPMVGLVNQDITTGDLATDSKINHAKKLFFTEPINMENMRSACVALAAVLEPIRKDLKTVIADADVESFFQLVNTFDIRHNNNYTSTLKHPEQLEWVFYSLLNTINTYTKLKSKLN